MEAWHPSAEWKARGTMGGLKGRHVCHTLPPAFCLFTPMSPAFYSLRFGSSLHPFFLSCQASTPRSPFLPLPLLSSHPPARHQHRVPTEDREAGRCGGHCV